MQQQCKVFKTAEFSSGSTQTRDDAGVAEDVDVSVSAPMDNAGGITPLTKKTRTRQRFSIWEEVSHDAPDLKSFLDVEPDCATHSPPIPIRLHLYRRKGSEQSALALSPEADLSNKLYEERFQ